MKPSILIDSLALLSPLTGIGRYTYEISKRLKKQDQYTLNFFYGYFSKNLEEPAASSNMKYLKSIIIKNNLIKMLARKVLNLFSSMFSKNYDIYWQSKFIPAGGIKAKKVVTTVHDFSFILHNNFQPKERVKYFRNNFLKNIYISDIIITASNYTKQEILDRLNFSEDKIKVIYHGVDHEIFKVHKDLKLDFEVPEKFILCVGSIEPRKNLLGLLNAYNLLDSKIKEEYKLILVGFKGWQNNEIIQLIEKNKENINYLGFISDLELAKVYNLASCFVFPSFYEGFGLPILEAMACGTPVVCSSTSSLPEVGGDAPQYCDPEDIKSIKHKIELVLKDKSLKKNMIQKGLLQASNFSWEKSANQHAKVFKEILNMEVS